jgi:hypothetical protein
MTMEYNTRHHWVFGLGPSMNCWQTAKLLLTFASTVILGAEFHGTHDHILLSDCCRMSSPVNCCWSWPAQLFLVSNPFGTHYHQQPPLLVPLYRLSAVMSQYYINENVLKQIISYAMYISGLDLQYYHVHVCPFPQLNQYLLNQLEGLNETLCIHVRLLEVSSPLYSLFSYHK